MSRIRSYTYHHHILWQHTHLTSFERRIVASGRVTNGQSLPSASLTTLTGHSTQWLHDVNIWQQQVGRCAHLSMHVSPGAIFYWVLRPNQCDRFSAFDFRLQWYVMRWASRDGLWTRPQTPKANGVLFRRACCHKVERRFINNETTSCRKARPSWTPHWGMNFSKASAAAVP
jgi:hypothetical protein